MLQQATLRLDETEDNMRKPIVGKVRKQVWFDERSMFTIVRMDLDEVPNFVEPDPLDGSIGAKGVLREVHPGERFRLHGRWTKDPRHGWTFQFDRFDREIPETDDGLVAFLSSPAFQGIGEKTAQRIVERFGKDTMDVIRNHSEMLLKVKGFTQKKVDQLVADFKKTEAYNDLYVKLRPFGVSQAKAALIASKYNDPLHILNDNPYQLVKDINGIGFMTADRIAGAFGIPGNSTHRLREAIRYVMYELSQQDGHVYLPLEKLQQTVVELLLSTPRRVEQNDVALVLSDMLAGENTELIMDEDQAVYLSKVHRTEKKIAMKLCSLSAQTPKPFPVPVGQLVTEAEKALNIQYAPEQKRAFEVLEKGNVVVITGGPGTGKSTLLKGMVRVLKQAFPRTRIALCAPTGKAAKRMTEITGLPASTAHRLLECRPGAKELEPQYNEYTTLPVDVLVVDEFSMVDMQLAGMLLRALPRDVVLIMIGDVDQLPSVGPGAVLKDIIDSGVIPTVRLQHIFRQENTSLIVVNSVAIREGKPRALKFDKTSFRYLKCETMKQTADEAVNLYKSFLAEGLSQDDVQILTPFRKSTETGATALNLRIQQELNPSKEDGREMKIGEQIFRPGDPVMQVKNNYEKGLFNGSTGTILDALPGSLKIQFEDLAEPVIFDREDAKQLVCNYATTIHKSQGSEYHTVIVVMSKAHTRLLQRRLIYTAVTRAKTRVIVVGEAQAFGRCIVVEDSSSRNTKLAERLREAAV